MKRYVKLILLLLLYTIVIYHLIEYNNFPFSGSYQFPLNEILIAYSGSVLVVIFVEWYYQFLLKNNKFNDKERIKKFLTITLLCCILLFTAAHLIRVRANGKLYYIVISFLLTILNMVFWVALIYGKNLVRLWTKATEHRTLNIKSGSKIYSVDLSDLSHFSSKNKIVIAHLKSGKDIVTNFNLKELEGILSSDFFRINRQYIIHKGALDIIKSAKNNTLQVQLKNQNSENDLVVSRYKVPSFRKWLA